MTPNTPELLLADTRKFDEGYFYCTYEELSWRDQTLRHIGEHVVKAGFKLVYNLECKGPEDAVVRQVIPDLALYRSQIINLLDIDPEDIDWEAHVGEEIFVPEAILWSAGTIARYTEPLEHDPEARHVSLTEEDLKEVPLRLHLAAATLADQHGVDLVEAQKLRMARPLA